MRRRTLIEATGALGLGGVSRGTYARVLGAADDSHRGARQSNGGKSQVNLNFLAWGGAFPFLNCLKTAQEWSYIDNSGIPDPDTLDADGYPKVISHGGVKTVFRVPSQKVRPGPYVVTWDGAGTIALGMQHRTVSGNKTSMWRGRYVFSTTESRFSVGIRSIGSPHVTNIKVFHLDDEAALQRGEIFGGKFKERLLEANFGVIRFLNWQYGNSSNVTTWESRRRESYAYYSGSELRASVFAGTTSNRGAAYEAWIPGFKLVDKATVTVRFNASCDSACTLNVNGTGPVEILNQYGNPLPTNGNSFVVGSSWRSLATLVYDATLNAWIKFGGDISMGAVGINSGCPPELMVRLCAEVGAHPHFVAPVLACDPLTDYMPRLAEYCRTSAPAWMVPRFEGPNELWNNASGFSQTHYAAAKARAYGWGPDVHNWYGKVLSVLGQAMSSVYGKERRAYQVLCGVQTARGATFAGTRSSDARLSSEKYVSGSAPPQEPFSKTPAARWVTHVCCAQYYVPSAYGTGREEELAAKYASAGDDQSAQASVLDAYASTSATGPGAFTLEKVAEMYSNWKRWALSFGVRGMCGYEGGYSPDFGSARPAVKMLRGASKKANCLEELTSVNYRNFVSLTDEGFAAEYPSCFQLSGSTPTDNPWSVLDDVYETPEPGQWRALVAFNQRT